MPIISYHFHDDYMFPSWQHIVWKCLRLFKTSNLLTVARMEVKLGTHALYIVSMTNNKKPQELFFVITSSFLKLANGSTHRNDVCLLIIISIMITCFHDDCILFEKASGSLKLLLHSSNMLTVARMEVKLGAHVFYIVSMTTTTTKSLRNFSL